MARVQPRGFVRLTGLSRPPAILAITHQLQMAKAADRVLVLEDGKVKVGRSMQPSMPMFTAFCSCLMGLFLHSVAVLVHFRSCSPINFQETQVSQRVFRSTWACDISPPPLVRRAATMRSSGEGRAPIGACCRPRRAKKTGRDSVVAGGRGLDDLRAAAALHAGHAGEAAEGESGAGGACGVGIEEHRGESSEHHRKWIEHC